MRAFTINIGGRALDYRMPGAVDLERAISFFSKTYTIKRVWNGGRHVLGELEKDGIRLFLKLATTEGIGVVTQREAEWNDALNHVMDRSNAPVWIPKNAGTGRFDDLFYLITEYFDGPKLVDYPAKNIDTSKLAERLDSVLDAALAIQSLPIRTEEQKHTTFLEKARDWFESLPPEIRKEYSIDGLLSIVKSGAPTLQSTPQHGDFTPWHMLCLSSGKLGLIDAEHGRVNGVELYDIGYLIQRVFSVLNDRSLAEQFYRCALKRGADPSKLRVILASRAIGGFLDEVVSPTPNYARAKDFSSWVFQL